MVFYLSVISVSCFFAFLSEKNKHTNLKFCAVSFWFSGVVMFLPLAFRGMGVDYDQYINAYNYSETAWTNYWQNYKFQPEPLYMVLNYLARWIFNSFQGVNVLCAAISISFTFKGIYWFKDKINLFFTIWSVGFLYYIFMFGLNRIMISVAIITWGYHYYFEGKKKSFFFWIIVSSLFHYSAILMIPFYYIMKWIISGKIMEYLKIKKVRIVLGVTLLMIIVYILTPIMFSGLSFFNRYSYLFVLSPKINSLFNEGGCYWLLIGLIWFKERVKEYLFESELMELSVFIYMLITIAVISVFAPVHRICYYFFPAIAIMYGIVPQSVSIFDDENMILTYRRNSYVFCLGTIIVGLLWLYKCTMLDALWAPAIVPYIMGDF